DRNVTGVQTCALPIYEPLAAGGDDHLVAVLLEDPGQGADQRLVVVGDEDPGRGVVGHLLSPQETRDRRCRRSPRAPWGRRGGWQIGRASCRERGWVRG